MRALTSVELTSVAGGGDEVTVTAPRPPVTPTGGQATPLMYNPPNQADVIGDLVYQNCTFLATGAGSALGWWVGSAYGAELGGAVGALVGLATVPETGPFGLVFLAGTGTAIGAEHGGSAGTAVGGWVGMNIGTIACPTPARTQ